jgi:glyoxylase-like metal-dependent hydrolase (beta-lactamase superfamily II)
MTATPPIQPIREIIPGIYQLQLSLANNGITQLSHVNSYLIQGTDGWLLIDPGWNTPLIQQTLENALKTLNLGFTDVSSIVITHCHPDHYGLAGKIKHLSPRTRMFMHRWEADLIESRYIKFTEPQEKMAALLTKHGVPPGMLDALGTASMPALEFITLSLPDHVLYGGEMIQTGIFDLEVIWTPGHSPGHICLYEARNQLLLSGDHVLPTITPNISYHILSGDNPLGDYIYALGKLGNLAVAQVHPGHESSFNDLQGRVQMILDHHNRRQKEIVEILDGSSYNCYQIASRLHWNIQNLTWEQFPPLQKRFAITETIAHVEHLRWNGKVHKTFENNRFRYNLV